MGSLTAAMCAPVQGRPAAQPAGGDLGPHELDVADLHLVALANLEDDRAEAADPIAIDRVVDRDLVVAGLLIVLAQLFGVLLHLPLIERLVRLDLHFLFEAGALDPLIAVETDAQHAKLGCDLNDEVVNAPRRIQLLVFDFDELEEAGAVERTDVAIEDDLIEVAALAHRHVGAHDLLIHVRRADELDRDRADLVDGSRLAGGGGGRLSRDRNHTRCQQPNDRETQGDDPAHRVTDGSFQSE